MSIPTPNPGPLDNTTPQVNTHPTLHEDVDVALAALSAAADTLDATATANAAGIAANAAAITTETAARQSADTTLQAEIDALTKLFNDYINTPVPPDPGSAIQVVGFLTPQLDKIIAARAAGSPTAEQTTLKNLYADFLAGSVASKTSHPTAGDISAIPAFIDNTITTGSNTVGSDYEANTVPLVTRCMAQAIRFYVEGDTACRDNVISNTTVTPGGVGYLSSGGFLKTTIFYTATVGSHTAYGNAKLVASWIMCQLATAASLVAYKDDAMVTAGTISVPAWAEADRQATRDWMWNTGFAVTPGGTPSTNPPATGAAMMNHTSANNWLSSMFQSRVCVAGWMISGNAASKSNGQAILQNAINWYRDMVTWQVYLSVDAASAKNASPPYPLSLASIASVLQRAQYWFFGDSRVGDPGVSGTVAPGSPYAAQFYDGLANETARDMGHLAFLLGGLANGCATAMMLGTDLFDDSTNDNGRRIRIGIEDAAGWVNEMLDQYWNNLGTYTGGIASDSAANALGTLPWTPGGGPTYGGNVNWVAGNLGTNQATPVGGKQPSHGSTPNQQAANFAVGGDSFTTGWGSAAYYLINVKGYFMPQLDRLRRRLIGSGTPSINNLAGMDGVTSPQSALDPSTAFHFHTSLDSFTWYFAPHTVIAHDGFNRNVVSGNWGTSDATNQSGDTLPTFAWAMSDDSAHPAFFTVDSTTGRARISIANGTSKGQTLPVNAANVDVYVRLDLDKLPLYTQTSFPSLHLQARRSGTTWYSAAARVNPPSASGQPSTLSLRIYASIAGVLTQLPGMGVTSTFTYAVGAGLWMRFYVKGTALKMKCWVSTRDTPANEPAAWSLESAADTQITAPGAVGIMYAMNGATDPGYPILLSADHLHCKVPV